MGALEFAKRFWAPLTHDNANVHTDEITHNARKSALVIDAKALCDAAKKESITSFQDKRTRTEALTLRKRMDAIQ
eukprot:2837463-Pyramimonas_sp.AAC.1